MINIEVLNDIKDEKLQQIEEMIKALDGIDYWKDDFLSRIGPASNVIDRAENELNTIINSPKYSNINADYIALGLFLRETAYWFATEIVDTGKNVGCPMNILNGYLMYLDYFFYRTEKQEIRRYKTIEELRENLFEQYKYNRNIKDNNKNNIKVLKLLTLIDEYKQIVNENERLNTNFDFGDVN